MKEKREIREYLEGNYKGKDVRFHEDGSVTCWADPMPNTNKSGRIFAGWVEDLIVLARQEKL